MTVCQSTNPSWRDFVNGCFTSSPSVRESGAAVIGVEELSDTLLRAILDVHRITADSAITQPTLQACMRDLGDASKVKALLNKVPS